MNDDFNTHELLHGTHDFPCSYLFKAIGKDEVDFVPQVLAAVRSVVGEQMEPPFNLRRSANKKHVSVSIEPTVEGPAQVVAIYENLKVIDGLVMLL